MISIRPLEEIIISATYSNSLSFVITNYLLTEGEFFTGKSQTETLPYWPIDSQVNTARPRFKIFPVKRESSRWKSSLLCGLRFCFGLAGLHILIY